MEKSIAAESKKEASRITVTIDGYEVIEKVVKSGGKGGRIYLPKSWIGKRVKIILLER